MEGDSSELAGPLSAGWKTLSYCDSRQHDRDVTRLPLC